MRPLEDASLGRCIPWRMRPLEDASLAGCVPWRMRTLRGCGPWWMRNAYPGRCVPDRCVPTLDRMYRWWIMTTDSLRNLGYPGCCWVTQLRSPNPTHGQHRSLLFQRAKKSRLSGPTPSNGPCNAFAPYKVWRHIKTKGTLIVSLI
jgi:hypothetical protein